MPDTLHPAGTDPACIADKPLDVAERTQLLVVGGGPAGLAAALEARRHGLQVVLVDEHPVPVESMGEDIPLFFGQRASGAVRNRNAMLEAVASHRPALQEALEAGVDVRLSTIAWGLYTNDAAVHWLPGRVAGLCDAERSWLLQFEAVIVAAGRRDMGLAFPGWELPGVMGATAAECLAGRYGALAARRAVVLGSGAEALSCALTLHRAGVSVIAVLEQAAAPVGPPALQQALAVAGIPLHTGVAIERAEGAVDGVEALYTRPCVCAPRDPAAGRRYTCDTVILGIGVVPVIELLQAAGCQMRFHEARGGYVPVLDAAQRCSVPGFYAVGDCAGIWAEKSLDEARARAEGIGAARDIAAAQGLLPTGAAPGLEPAAPAGAVELGSYRIAWVRSCLAGGDATVCRCEEVTAQEILQVRPPRYLQPHGPLGPGCEPLARLAAGAPPDPDQIKRLTRAGMGVCQGRRCREQVQALLAHATGLPLAQIPLASYRAPVRPLSLRLAAQVAEPPAMSRHWDTWFGMASQYTPPWKITAPYTVAGRDLDDPVASE